MNISIQDSKNRTSDYEARALEAILQKHSRLDFTPGSKYGYSNIAFWLLGGIVEKTSGLTYSDYVAQHITDPLGIPADDFSFVMSSEDRLAKGYQRKVSVFTLALYLMTDSKIWGDPENGWSSFKPLYHDGKAHGGAYTTSIAATRVLRDLLQEEPVLLGAATRDEMFEPQKSRSGAALGTTLGWSHGALSDARWVGKTGGGAGFHSNIRVYP